MKRNLLTTVLAMSIIGAGTLRAQSLESSFEFLKLPVSAHSSSLGGHTVSLFDPDPTLYVTNPALLSANDRRMLGLNTMTWFSGTTVAGAQFCNVFDERSRYAFNARYVSYGKMKETTDDGTVTGTFTSKDMTAGASWAYMLTDCLSGGVTANLITSHYGSMTSVAIGVDLGLLWVDTENNMTIGVAATNIGGQIKAFENNFQKLPFDLCSGLSWEPEHAPLRFTLTLENLTRWDESDFYFSTDDTKGFGEILKRHISMGADLNLADNLYLAIGLNLRTRAEMAGKGNKGLTGLSMGTGLRIGKLTFDLSYGKYQVSESSLICNFAFNI